MEPTTEVKKLGTEETKEMLLLLFSMGKAAVEAKKNDGEINAADLNLVLPVIPKIAPAIEGADQIIAELKDLDAEEAEELVSFIATKVGEVVSKEDLVVKIIDGLEAAKAVHKFLKHFI